jgi:hypothetical protein
MLALARFNDTLGGSAGAGFTTTVTASLTLPLAPLQARPKVVVAESGPTELAPDVLREPLQPPDAEQVLASEEDQLRVTLSPSSTVVLEALSERVGGGVLTITFTEAVSVPPGPEQARL